MGKRASIGLALAIGGIALAASVLAPYASERAASDYSDFVLPPAETAEDNCPFPAVDWGALLAENPDVVGWVHVKETLIDYPVVQARADDPQRYLSCSLDGERNGHGTPYVDADCNGTNAPVVLTYGHNMIDGTMYSAFASYTDQAFFDGHREILFMTPTRNYKLEAVAAKEVSAIEHHPRTRFASAAELSSYIASEAQTAQASSNIPARVNQVFEFVCCSYGTSDGRTIVFAVEA